MKPRQRKSEVASPNSATKDNVLSASFTDLPANGRKQQRYESLVQSIDGIVWEVDAKTFRFTFVSNQAERILGYPVSQWLEPNFWVDHLHPDDRDRAVSFCMEATSRRENHQFEYRMIAADGSVVSLRDIVTVNVADDESVVLRGVMVDITERRRAQEALIESESRWRTIFDDAAIGIAVVSADGYPIESNPALQRMLGYTQDELCIMRFVEFTHPDDVGKDLALYQELLESKRDYYQIEKRYVRKDGQIVWGNLTASVTRDVHGNWQLGVGMVEDITERKQAEAALVDAEKKYRSIVENAVEGIFQTTPDGRFISANPAMARMLGFESPAELINTRTDIAQEHYVDPQRRETFKRSLEDNGFVINFEAEAYRKDKSRIWISENVRAVRNGNGTVVFYEGTIQDITQRKHAQQELRKSEERYRHLFENSKDAIYVHDLKGIYVSVNGAAEKLSGYPRAEIVGRHFSQFIAPRYLPQIQAILDSKLLEQRQTSCEVELIAKDGWHVPVELNSSLICENGIPVGVQGTAREITERKRAEEALRSFSRQLIEAQEAERQNVARELHDQIGQVLTAVRIHLQTIWDSCNTIESKARFEEGVALIDEALRQVRDLSLDLRPSMLDDLGLIAALRWYSERYTRRTGICAKTAIEVPPVQLRLRRELETACFRIVQEALTNAARHSRAKNVVISLKATEREIVLTVIDDGIGFDERLSRSAAPLNRLGLRGMRERALALGGRLEIKSACSQGTEIQAYFPNSAQDLMI